MDTPAFEAQRRRMVDEQIRARGVRDERVLAAMGRVPRELFVDPDVRRHAYEDRPLPIAAGQTISQPYIVAYMVEALGLSGGETVLEIGAGSGYAAAVLAEIAGHVISIERVAELAEFASANIEAAGYDNVTIIHGDGTRGWPDEAPYDAILISAGAPDVPEALKKQLKIGGRMVIPVGALATAQELIRITRTGADEFEREDLADVRFVPLIGEEGWQSDMAQTAPPRVVQTRPRVSITLSGRVAGAGESFTRLEDAELDGMMQRIGSSRVVLIGEASHGTSEFYRMRQRITRRLVEEKGFNTIAIEGDWPDVARIDDYVRHRDVPARSWEAFSRFPTWMWRNREVAEFVDWLRQHNLALEEADRVAMHGLDLYSLYRSASAVIAYLEQVDAELAEVARQRYGCLSPWQGDPAAYGHAALSGRYRSCENDVAMVLADLFAKQQELACGDREREAFFDAVQNARLSANAERYYRVMYYGSRASWNLRDQHMFDTLKAVMEFHGPDAKVVVWAHNSHVGDARATEMSARGEHNIGQLTRQAFGEDMYAIGFGTDHGTVAAADNWGGDMRIMQVRPSHPQSYERVFHLTNAPGLLLGLRGGERELLKGLSAPRLQRAIGVIYRPETEMASHYFEAELPRQFDEYIWIDETHAVEPLPAQAREGMPDTYPFGV